MSIGLDYDMLMSPNKGETKSCPLLMNNPNDNLIEYMHKLESIPFNVCFLKYRLKIFFGSVGEYILLKSRYVIYFLLHRYVWLVKLVIFC